MNRPRTPALGLEAVEDRLPPARAVAPAPDFGPAADARHSPRQESPLGDAEHRDGRFELESDHRVALRSDLRSEHEARPPADRPEPVPRDRPLRPLEIASGPVEVPSAAPRIRQEFLGGVQAAASVIESRPEVVALRVSPDSPLPVRESLAERLPPAVVAAVSDRLAAPAGDRPTNFPFPRLRAVVTNAVGDAASPEARVVLVANHEPPANPPASASEGPALPPPANAPSAVPVPGAGMPSDGVPDVPSIAQEVIPPARPTPEANPPDDADDRNWFDVPVVVERAIDIVLPAATLLSGALPVDTTAVVGAAEELFARLGEIDAGAESDWPAVEEWAALAGAVIVVGGSAYAVRADRPRRASDVVALGTGSALARWEERHDDRPR